MGRRHHRKHSGARMFDGVAFFDGCRRRNLARIAPHTDRVRVRAGTLLAVAGRPARELIVLLDGEARSGGDGGAGMLVRGDAVTPGAAARLAELPATVRALADLDVLVVNGPAFRWLVREDPALAHLMAPSGASPAADLEGLAA